MKIHPSCIDRLVKAQKITKVNVAMRGDFLGQSLIVGVVWLADIVFMSRALVGPGLAINCNHATDRSKAENDANHCIIYYYTVYVCVRKVPCMCSWSSRSKVRLKWYLFYGQIYIFKSGRILEIQGRSEISLSFSSAADIVGKSTSVVSRPGSRSWDNIISRLQLSSGSFGG